MFQRALCILVVLVVAQVARAGEREVTGIHAVHRHGQTFVTWKDVAEGEDGAKFRYSLYRSEKPITADNLDNAELCYHGVLNYSGKLFGHVFNMKDRLDPDKPYAIIEEGGKPLPPWSGLAVHTVRKAGKAYYAVVATDEKLEPLSVRSCPARARRRKRSRRRWGRSSRSSCTTRSSAARYVPRRRSPGQKGLPLRRRAARQPGAGRRGGRLRRLLPLLRHAGDGLPRRPAGRLLRRGDAASKTGNYLLLRPRRHRAPERHAGHGDLLVRLSTACRSAPAQRAAAYSVHRERHGVDHRLGDEDVTPPIRSGSRRAAARWAAWGSTTYGFRHPERFAAVYPNRPRTRQRGLPSLARAGLPRAQQRADGRRQDDYFDRMDMVKFAAEHPDDLPFFGWCCGRRDGFATGRNRSTWSRR